MKESLTTIAGRASMPPDRSVSRFVRSGTLVIRSCIKNG